MTILAIDPGPVQSAYVLWDGARVLEHAINDNTAMLDVVMQARAHRLAIEMIASYGMAVGSEVFETCVWVGRFMQRWAPHHSEDNAAIRIPRGDIKVHLCRSVRAKDANVRQALIDRFGEPGTKKQPGPLHGVTSHCWAALAVAVCAYDRLILERAA